MDLSIAIELCKEFEGLKLTPYLCPAGIPTIGYGSTFYEDGTRVTLQDPTITEPRAQELLEHELRTHCAPAVLRLCPGLANDEARFNAMVDFVYNLGSGRLQTSTLRRCIAARDWQGAVEQINKWVWGAGKKLPGLVKRREAESVLMFGGSES